MKSWLSLFAVFVISAGLWWPAVRQARESITRAYWFEITGDEAYHAEAIERLAVTGLSTNYQGGPYLASTGPTVLAPAALLRKILDVPSPVAGRMVVIAFFLSLILLLGSPIAVGVFFWILSGLSDWGYYTFGIMGEVAGVTCMVALYFALKTKRWVQAGVLAGLSILAKPFFMFLAPLAVIYASTSGTPRDRLKKAAAVILGGGLVISAWIVLLWPTSGSVLGGFRHILQVAQGINQITGAGRFAGAPDSFVRHAEGLLQVLAPRSIGLIFLGILACFYFKLERTAKAFLCFALVHLFWWFFLSPGTESRYLLPAVAAAALVIGLELKRVVGIRPRTWQYASVFALFCLLVPAYLRAEKQLAPLQADPRKCAFCRQLSAESYWATQSGTDVYSTSKIAPHDQDYLLTRGYRIHLPARASDLAGMSPVVVGERADPELRSFVIQNCKPTVLVGVHEGFWSCKK